MSQTGGVVQAPDIGDSKLASVLELVDTLFVNREAWLSAAEALRTPLSPTMLKRQTGEIVVTMGAGGCHHIGDDGHTAAPGVAMNAVDTTGAGDCFAAAYVTAKLEGASLPDRLRFANAAAALACTCFGAQAGLPRRHDVLELLVPDDTRSRAS